MERKAIKTKADEIGEYFLNKEMIRVKKAIKKRRDILVKELEELTGARIVDGEEYTLEIHFDGEYHARAIEVRVLDAIMTARNKVLYDENHLAFGDIDYTDAEMIIAMLKGEQTEWEL